MIEGDDVAISRRCAFFFRRRVRIIMGKWDALPFFGERAEISFAASRLPDATFKLRHYSPLFRVYLFQIIR